MKNLLFSASFRNNVVRASAIVLFLAVISVAEAQEERIVPGAERIDQYIQYTRSHTTAVVANHTSMVGTAHLVDTLCSLGVDIETIFCPEHGFRGTADAGAHIDDSVDPKTGIPIISLYGNNTKPTHQQLKDINMVIFDLQDVGCRFYTYISTLQYVMEACAEGSIPLIVLDRPNPNGHYVDGPVMEKKYTSFVGMQEGIPAVYGMTIGEYALMLNEEHRLKDSLKCDLRIVKMLNYSHDSALCRSIVLPVAPSPNLRTPQAVALYPSLCLFEGTNISVGRQTPYPFEVLGTNLQRSYNDFSLDKWVDLRNVEVASKFDLQYLKMMYRKVAKGKFFLKSNFFEKLAGTATLRKQLMQGASDEVIRASWEPALSRFKELRKKYLLYPEEGL